MKTSLLVVFLAACTALIGCGSSAPETKTEQPTAATKVGGPPVEATDAGKSAADAADAAPSK